MTLQSYMNTDNINASQRGTNKVHVSVVGEGNKHSSLSTIFGIVKCYLYTVKYRQNKLKTSFKRVTFTCIVILYTISCSVVRFIPKKYLFGIDLCPSVHFPRPAF